MTHIPVATHGRQMSCRLLSGAIPASALILTMVIAPLPSPVRAERAEAILNGAGVTGGLVVHVGCGTGILTAALRINERTVVQGLDTDAAAIEAAREYIRSRGVYGPVSVREFDGEHLPYVDNLVNLIVVSGAPPSPAGLRRAGACRVSREEMLRVLAPRGAAVFIDRQSEIGDRRFHKPVPPGIDDWPQYLHGADNNAVAQDTVVGPPRHLRWTSAPRWSRSHMGIPTVTTVVSSCGRLFMIEDAGSVENPFLPGRFRLVARDAFNGVLLWVYDFSDWDSVTRYIKDQAVQLQRRLAATENAVYCTPGLNAPVTALDAATGKPLRTFAGSEKTQEFAYEGGHLFLVIGDPMNAARYNIVKAITSRGINLGGSDEKAPFGGTGFHDRYAPERPNKPRTICRIAVMDAVTGEELWRTEELANYIASTLAVRGDTAVYQTAQGFFCVERDTGEARWRKEKAISSHDGTEPNVVVLADTVAYAQEGGNVHAYTLKDGVELWTAPIKHNYEKSADLFVVGKEVWTGGTGRPTARDAKTGEAVRVIKQRHTGPMGHDRCWRNLITSRFYINSKTGGADFCTLDGKHELPNLWVRGTCGFGVLPCNGMLYTTPYSCQCSTGVMLPGMNAMYTHPSTLEEGGGREKIERKTRLVKGPAYGKVEPVEAGTGAWPMYRGNVSRSGATKSAVPAQLARCWKTSIGSAPSAPVVAAGMAFVAAKDVHQVCALDASTGEEAWRYTAGGRIDSPPTFSSGHLVFGCRDGWVHCLRAKDGALAWRMTDLPDRLVGAHDQVESAWPVSGSVLVHEGVVYFAAGRNENLDGGIFLCGVKLDSGEVLCRGKTAGNMDILVLERGIVHMRHAAAKLDLTRANPVPHVLPTAGFLDDTPQHRTYWTIAGSAYSKPAAAEPSGDILVKRGNEFYEVQGFPVHRYSYFDPRVKGYVLYAGTLGGTRATPTGAELKAGRRGRKRRGIGGRSRPAARWQTAIPCTGTAMAMADDIVFVAGTPCYFPPDHRTEKYVAAYRGELGAIIIALSAGSGEKLAEIRLDAPPAWDGLAAADGALYVSLQDGSVCCLAPATD